MPKIETKKKFLIELQRIKKKDAKKIFHF